MAAAVAWNDWSKKLPPDKLMILYFINDEWPKAKIGLVIQRGIITNAAESIRYLEGKPAKQAITWGLKRATEMKILWTTADRHPNLFSKKEQSHFETRMAEIFNNRELQEEQEFTNRKEQGIR